MIAYLLKWSEIYWVLLYKYVYILFVVFAMTSNSLHIQEDMNNFLVLAANTMRALGIEEGSHLLNILPNPNVYPRDRCFEDQRVAYVLSTLRGVGHDIAVEYSEHKRYLTGIYPDHEFPRLERQYLLNRKTVFNAIVKAERVVVNLATLQQ